MRRPSAISPIATHTPPAPKSLQRMIRFENSGFLNNLCSFLSSTGFPFCTSEPHVCKDSSVCSLDEPVAPPQPSRPVAPPRSKITLPATGSSCLTCERFTAPTTAPTSNRFAL